MTLQIHQPDVAPEVTENEDDLIRRGDWRRPSEDAGIAISFAAYTAIGSPSGSPDAQAKCLARTALRITGFAPVDT